MGGEYTQTLFVLADGGQCRAGVFAGLDVITADDGHILRNPEAVLLQGPDGTEGQQIGGGKHRLGQGASFN
ncbi:hypothetical protein D3C75_396440 [compost metagenome]